MARNPSCEAKVETYRRDGLVIPNYRLDPELSAAMRAVLERLLRGNG